MYIFLHKNNIFLHKNNLYELIDMKVDMLTLIWKYDIATLSHQCIFYAEISDYELWLCFQSFFGLFFHRPTKLQMFRPKKSDHLDSTYRLAVYQM